MNPSNERFHIARMLKRAQRRQRRANGLVEKWSAKLDALGPEQTPPAHPLLWVEELPSTAAPNSGPATLPLSFDPVPMKEAAHEPS